MAQNTTDLKTASYVTEAPGELAGLVGRRAEVVVAATSKPAAAKALGITLHRFNKEAEWVPGVSDRLTELTPGVPAWRSATAGPEDPWWVRNDEGIFVELSVEDEDDPEDELEGYDTVVDTTAPEGPQVLIASRRVDLTDEPVGPEASDAEGAARPPLVQYTEDGSRDFEDELEVEPAGPEFAAHMMGLDTDEDLVEALGMDEDDVAAVAEHLDEVRERLDASPDGPGLDDEEDDGSPVISDEDWAHLTGQTPPAPSTDGVIRLSAEQSAELRRRIEIEQAAEDELNLDDDRELAVKLMAELNRQDPDDARKVIGLGGVQSQMWLTAARIARRHYDR